MEIPKEKVVQVLRDRGQDDVADQADQHLPDPIDTDKHADQLKQHGVDPGDLLGNIGL
jgi:hypothetical protein